MLISSVLGAVATIGVTSLPGFVGGALGLIHQDFISGLSRFHLNCLVPCLIFSTFAGRLTLASLWSLWVLILWSSIQLGTATLVSQVLARTQLLHAWASEGHASLLVLMRLAITFQNIGAFCLPMIQSLCQTGDLFEGHTDHCFDDGALMVFGYHIPWDVGMWTQGYASILALNATHSSEKDTSISAQEEIRTSEFIWKPESWIPSLHKVFVRSVNPIFGALLLGVIVGLTPSLQGLFYGHGALFSPIGDGLKRVGLIVPVLGLQILSGTLGIACRNLWDDLNGGSGKEKNVSGSSSPSRRNLKTWLVVVLFGKLIIMPLIGFVLFIFLAQVELHPREDVASSTALISVNPENVATSVVDIWAPLGTYVFPKDRLLRTVLMLQWSSPSCLTLVALCHQVGLDVAIAQTVALTYLVMYSAVALTTTFWVSAGLALL